MEQVAVAESLDREDMGRELNDYFQRDDEIKELTKLQDIIKSHAREYATTNGTPDNKGSIKVDIPEGKIQLIVRESISLDEEKTVEFLQSHGFNGAVHFKPVVDEEVLADLFREGQVSVEDMRDLVVRKSNTALYLRKPKMKEEQYSAKDKGVLSSMFAALEL